MARKTFQQALDVQDTVSRQYVQQLLAAFASAALSDGAKFYMPDYITEWTQRATATNATATATKASPGGALALYVTGFYLTYSGAANSAQLATLADGGTTIYDIALPAATNQTINMAFPNPIKITDATAATLTLPAGGTSVVGVAGLRGFTL